MLRFDGIADGMGNLFGQGFPYTVRAKRAADGMVFGHKCLKVWNKTASSDPCFGLTV